MPTLIPQPHGGAILSGGTPGQTPGPGRPRDEVRAALREIAAGKGVKFLDSLMDGEVPVRFVGTCPHCGKESRPDLMELSAVAEAVGKSVDQRLKANDQTLRYGVGTVTETLTPEDYTTRAGKFMALARRELVEVEGVAVERVDAAFGRALDHMATEEK